MLRLILLIGFILYSTSLWAAKAAPIEIYAGGRRYASIEEYKNRDLKVQEVKNTTEQSKEIEETAKTLGINVDLKKVKTIEVGPKVSPETQEKLKSVALDGNVDEAIADFKRNFKQNWNNPQAQSLVSSELLEDKIREAIGDQKDPILLISDHGKMRIMALTPKDLPKAQ